MASDLIDRIARSAHEAFCEEKRAQGYHLPRECKNRFGCGKCLRSLRPWDELPELTQNELLSSAQAILGALEGLGYKIIPVGWVGAPLPSEEVMRLAGHTNVHCRSRLGEPCTCTI